MRQVTKRALSDVLYVIVTTTLIFISTYLIVSAIDTLSN